MTDKASLLIQQLVHYAKKIFSTFKLNYEWLSIEHKERERSLSKHAKTSWCPSMTIAAAIKETGARK